MISRRALLQAGALTAAAGARRVNAQSAAGRQVRLGFLGTASQAGYVREVEWVRAGLRDHGLVEGRNLSIDFRWAEGDPQRLRALAAELAASRPDAILTHALAGTRAAAEATRSIPIVMLDGPDLAAIGLVASLARPGGNVTGSTSFVAEAAAKRLELLVRAAPRAGRIARLVDAGNPMRDAMDASIEAAAEALKLRLIRQDVRGRDELPSAFDALGAQGCDALLVHDAPPMNAMAEAVAAHAAARRWPSVGYALYADAGGLLGYGSNREAVYRRAGSFVARIVEGAHPGELPIERATRFDTVVNLKMARALELRIPQAVLLQASRVIE